MTELEIRGEEKLHEESLKKFLAGGFGKIYRKEILELVIAEMKDNGAASAEITNHFFNPATMEYEDGDVEIIVSLKLKKIGEDE
jgi:hypothetical protein